MIKFMPIYQTSVFSNNGFKGSGAIRTLVFVMVILFTPTWALPSSQTLDSIDIISIRQMQLLKKNNDYWLDIACLVRNSGKNTVKFNKCNSQLSIVLKDAEDIDVGTSFQATILIPKAKSTLHTDSIIRFVTQIGKDIEQLHYDISASDEMSSLLMDAKPIINLRIKSSFELGLQIKHGWVYLKGVKIDWVIPLSIPRYVFIKTFKTIEAEAEGDDMLTEDEMDKLLDSDQFNK